MANCECHYQRVFSMGFSISPGRAQVLWMNFLGSVAFWKPPRPCPSKASENYLVGGDLTMVNSDENSG